ncbi:MAG: hypothetical protein LC109_05455 [Bacteroidia bacterium]|nr:hypothetical protein [Bacteroidia bacterium]
MEFGLRDIIYIVGIVTTAVATFLTTKHNIKEFVRDKLDSLKDLLNDQKIEIERLKAKDENQQQIIDQFQKQVLDHLPALFEILKEKKDNGRKK